MGIFDNKVVLITGGSSGIGACAAKLFASHGAQVAFTYHNNSKGAEETEQAIVSVGGEALAIKADITSDTDVPHIIDKTIERFGRIDVLVNNAGGYIAGDEWDGTVDIWRKSLDQNLVSMMNISKYVVEIFQKQGTGVMVNIAARHALGGEYDALSYGAAKAGVINITQAYAKLLAPYGRANVISPSATEAGYWLTAPKEELEEMLANRPNHKLVDPMTIAEKIVFLASDDASDITGQNFPITE